MEKTTKTFLMILNDESYGDERPYNALRLGLYLAKQPVNSVELFMKGDGTQFSLSNQRTPNGLYNLERMLASLAGWGEVAT